MNLAKLTLLFIAVLGFTAVKAQENTDSTQVEEQKEKKKVPLTYSLNVGLYNYRGDVGFTRELGTVESFTPAVHIGAEYKLHSAFGIGLNAGYGTLVKNAVERNSFRNFKSVILSGGLRATFHFANGFILAEDYPIDPFISFGVDALSFTPKTDSLDSDGNRYYYWQDGTIRDVSQESGLPSNELQRDHDYETEIPANGESNIALAFPIEAGFNFVVTPYLKGQLKQSVLLTNSDFIDGYVAGKANDILLFTSVGVIFNPAGLVKREKKSREFDEIDFVSLLKADGDADGVLDIDDKCQLTEEGIKVDIFGCPLDTDADGIPDHLDKEIKTPETAIKIDSNGVAIPDSLVAKAAQDTVVTLRDELCEFYPSMCQGDETDIEYQILNTGSADKSLLSSKIEPSKKPIEEIKKAVDIDGDGKVTSKEIYESIDRYFDGKSEVDLGDIHKLIDYYFEQ